jgi:AraC-like DNA-binding protein
VASDVSRALASRVGRDDTRIQTIARTLATSARSLQRRLAAAGISYQQLLNLARKEAAEHYLTDSPLSIGEVAYLLGYSEPAAFTRAFRRWNKVTPQAFRRRPRGERLRMTASAESENGRQPARRLDQVATKSLSARPPDPGAALPRRVQHGQRDRARAAALCGESALLFRSVFLGRPPRTLGAPAKAAERVLYRVRPAGAFPKSYRKSPYPMPGATPERPI